jgi:N-acyl homoserine lactone hydrolase
VKVHAIRTGTVRIRPSQRRGRGRGTLARQFNVLRDRAWTEPLPIYAWAIEHPDGVIVVDTGDTAHASEPGYLPRWHPYFRLAVRLEVAPEEEIGPQLKMRGIEPGDVRAVILTHFHTDHTGGLHHFPHNEVFVSTEDHELASGLAGRLRGYLPNRWPVGFRPSPIDLDPIPFGPFERSRRVTADGAVVVVPTPGHTPNHVSVVVEDGATSYFLAGDVSYTEGLLLEETVDGVSPDGDTARATTRKVLQYARERPTVYLPSHDPLSGERLAQNATIQVD